MFYQDKTLKCADCGAEFVFTAGEQEFHASKGFTTEPRRCPACRKARKQQKGGEAPRPVSESNDRPPRQMYDAVCAECGKETKVPFQPTGSRPVYCSDCYKNNSGSFRSSRGGSRPSGSHSNSSSRNDGFDFSSLSTADYGGFDVPSEKTSRKNGRRDGKRRGRDHDDDNDNWY